MRLAIFDLDDTLIDFAATREAAYACLSARVAEAGLDGAAFVAACRPVDRPIFARFERGELTRDEYRLRRFSEPLASLGAPPDPDLVAHLNQLFMACVNDRPMLYPDALPVLARLRAAGIPTAILTNGPSDGQRRKLAATGLAQAVDHIAIGEETGFSKPLARAYHAVADHFAVAPAQACMVGDSPELDYDGARQAGLQALLLDRDARHQGGPREAIGSLDAVPSACR
ncbi:HAD family hydrolase [Piscinibacter gummiphilus]|uniref:Uncharacterized protein n=1 Tax=Piscinibacter gummiphilus TaxID=946333 RepID=A0A1W6L6F7_9BURK|nr:HAD family hydrolase [Piscinibacter gummiphilus]ARN19843.1 hypothetical protein A4W93_07910 [Piscinibacter gummiphilus]ATU64515.1 HAD family hydrolase [Piscinibacter gummiphilus]GLS95076.1 hydrolase [Piscinibacter gummiphilus]